MERFAAQKAALDRGDKIENDALMSSAPRRRYSFCHTFGLAQGFLLLSLEYGFSQWAYCTELQLLSLLSEAPVGKAKKAEYEDARDRAVIALVSNCIAWREICREYGLDPHAMLRGMPFRERAEIAESIVLGMPHQEFLDLPEVRGCIDAMRDLVESVRRYWG